MPRHINDYDFSKLNDERLEKEIKEFVNHHSIIVDGISLEDLKEKIIDKFEDKVILSNVIEDFNDIIELANETEKLRAQNTYLIEMLSQILKYSSLRELVSQEKPYFWPLKFYQVEIMKPIRFIQANLEGDEYLSDLQKSLFSYCKKEE